jgi:hypothetical protein
MIKVNPAHRITSSELVEHPWFLVILNFENCNNLN